MQVRYLIAKGRIQCYLLVSIVILFVPSALHGSYSQLSNLSNPANANQQFVIIQTLTDAPAVQNNESQRAQMIINNRQNHTNGLTDFYMWLDRDGKIVWISNMNSTTYQKYKGFDLSYRHYFTVPRDTHMPYYSGLVESNDKVPRLYISYPILSKQGLEYKNINNESKLNDFHGTIVAGVNGITMGNILKSQLLPQFNNTVSLLDNKGIILYADNSSFIGKYIFGKEFQSTHFLSSINISTYSFISFSVSVSEKKPV